MARALIAVALALALAGCGAAGDGEGSGGASAIDFQLTADAGEVAVYEELVRAYEQASGERVNLVPVPDRRGHLQKLTTAFAARRPPAVWLINHRNLGGFLRPEAVEPVGSRLRNAGDYLPVALEAFTFGGKLQCVPQNASSLVVYVNRDRFASAGVEVPAAGWSYDELVAAATRLRGAEGHAVGIEPSVIRVAPFVWSAGGELVDDEDAPERFTLDTPESRRGVEALLRLGRDGLGPSLADVKGKPLEERFIDGELAMFFSSRREVPNFRAIEGFEWDVVPFPVIERPATVLHSDGFCISRGEQVEAAWRFVEFAAGPEGQRVLARGGRTVPSLRAVAESPDFLDPGAEPRSSQVFLDQIDVMRRLPTTRDFTRAEDAANLALEQAFYGRIGVPELLERIARETDGRFGEGAGG